jgi:hypothetical protein
MRSVVRMMPIAAVAVMAMFPVACGEAGEDSEEGGSAHTVRPTGGPAKVQVTVPPNLALQPEVTIRKNAWNTPKENLAVGTPVEKLPGRYCAEANITVGGQKSTVMPESCYISLEAGKTTAIAFGGVIFARSGSDVVLGLDEPLFAPAANGQNPVPVQIQPIFSVTGAVPFAEGHHDIGVFKLDIKANQIITKYLDADDGRVGFRVLPPDPNTRTLPDVPADHGVRFGEGRSMTKAFTRVEKPIFTASSHSAKFLYLYPGVVSPTPSSTGQAVALFHSPGASDPKLKIVKFARLEVDDVAVSMPNGTKQTVRGMFTARLRKEDKTFERADLVNKAPTGAGVDVPAGDYQVRITFQSPLTNKEETQVLDVTL